jgi:hypothetical protein
MCVRRRFEAPHVYPLVTCGKEDYKVKGSQRNPLRYLRAFTRRENLKSEGEGRKIKGASVTMATCM